MLLAGLSGFYYGIDLAFQTKYLFQKSFLMLLEVPNWFQYTIMTFFKLIYASKSLILFSSGLLLYFIDPPTYQTTDNGPQSDTKICAWCICHIDTVSGYFRYTTPEYKNWRHHTISDVPLNSKIWSLYYDNKPDVLLHRGGPADRFRPDFNSTFGTSKREISQKNNILFSILLIFTLL